MNEKLAFIGAGKLGTTLAQAFFENGYEIPIIISKRIEDRFLRQLLNTNYKEEAQAPDLKNINIIFLTTPDDQIKIVSHNLVKLEVNWNKKLIIHTSGCLNSDELSELKSKGAKTGSIHPMQTFDDFFINKTIFNEIFFSVEGDKEIIVFAEKMAKVFGANLLRINPQEKTLYHIAAVASSNFIVAILDYVFRIYQDLNFDQTKIKEIMKPIIQQTIKNFEKKNGKDILTGPISRGDINTVNKHLEYLERNKTELLPLYKEISNYIVQFISK